MVIDTKIFFAYMIKRISLLIFILVASNTTAAQTTVLKAGKLLDPVSGKIHSKQLIIINNKKIQYIGNNTKIPANAKVIDLSNATLLPGMMDAHSHLCWHINQRKNDGYVLSIVRQPTAYRAIQGVMNARDILMSGFTTVRDVGNAGNYADSALRMAIEDGLVPGPTMINAGRLIAPFGGQRWVIPERPDFTQPEYYFADTQDEIKKAIRRNVHFGAKLVKLIVDDQKYIYSMEDIKFAVAEADKMDMKVAAHVATKQGAINAINAGVHTIEHGFGITPDVLQLAAKKKIWFVSTSFSLPVLQSVAKDSSEPPAHAYQKIINILRSAYKAQTPIAFGADVIGHMDEYNRGEANLTFIQSFLDAGATPLQIIQALTINASQAINVHGDRGYLKAGYFADIIATPENPLDNINTLNNVHFVMKEGEIHKHHLPGRPSNNIAGSHQ